MVDRKGNAMSNKPRTDIFGDPIEDSEPKPEVDTIRKPVDAEFTVVEEPTKKPVEVKLKEIEKPVKDAQEATLKVTDAVAEVVSTKNSMVEEGPASVQKEEVPPPLEEPEYVMTNDTTTLTIAKCYLVNVLRQINANLNYRDIRSLINSKPDLEFIKASKKAGIDLLACGFNKDVVDFVTFFMV